MFVKNKCLLVVVIAVVVVFNTTLITFSKDRFAKEDLSKTVKMEFNFYGNQEYSYEEEQPVKLKIFMECNPYKAVDIGRNDWYNMLEFSIQIEKELSTYNEKGEIIKQGGYPAKKEEKRKINYKVLEGEDLTDGKIQPEEVKSAIVEIINEGNKPFKAGYKYDIYTNLLFEDSVGALKSHSIVKLVNIKQKKDKHIRKAQLAEKEEDYALAAEHYKEALKIQKEIGKPYDFYHGYNLLEIISKAYAKNKDYKNAKKYILEAINYVDKEIEEEENKRKEKYNKLVKEKGKIMTYEEFSKKKIIEKARVMPMGLDKIKFSFGRKLKKYDELIAKEEEGK
jgi:hypothetical protein